MLACNGIIAFAGNAATIMSYAEQDMRVTPVSYPENPVKLLSIPGGYQKNAAVILRNTDIC